ncbi:MAG: hypothetical protein U0R27_10450 [Candidatus Nanopelagicales bacterium]|nr:hypothetical protein [Actinomycetota bacterium]
MVQWGMRWAAVAVATTSLALSTSVAHAGTWTPVDTGLVDTSRPGVSLRKGTTFIVWTTPDGELASRTVSAKGRLGATRVQQRGFSFLSADPVRVGSDWIAAGTRALPGSSLYWAGAAFATDGTTLEPLTDDFAYLSQGQDALRLDGRLLYAYTDGGATVQVASPGSPPVRITRGTAFEPALASDGEVTHLGWYSQGEGLVLVDLEESVVSPQVVVPGSAYLAPNQRVALAVRGGQPWTAFPSAAKRIRVWTPQTTSPVEVATSEPVVAVDLAVAGPRLWLAYATTQQVCVQRSAANAVVFGAPTCRPAAASAVTLAAGEYADVVATVAPKALHARLFPSVSVRTRPRAGTVVVRDAGRPLAKARVSVGTQKARTDAKGRARLRPWPKKQTVQVNAAGYERWSSR